MSLNSLGVANKVLDAASAKGISVTPMQLQKLLYFVSGWHMETSAGNEILSDRFEAWQYGPVMPIVYHEFKSFGSSPIAGRATNPFSGEPYSASLDKRQEDLINEVVSIYGNLSGAQMSHLTHNGDTPWAKAWNGGIGKGEHISPSDMLKEFQQLRANVAAA